jgi:short-subunit dehydrogenase
MMSSQSKGRRTHIITGPTSGIGRCTALELAKHGTVVLVGRDPSKLNNLQSTITGNGGQAVSIVCELSDLASVERAASEIIALKLPIRDFHNNAGIMTMRAAKNAQG